jgi:hypothetical protein
MLSWAIFKSGPLSIHKEVAGVYLLSGGDQQNSDRYIILLGLTRCVTKVRCLF